MYKEKIKKAGRRMRRNSGFTLMELMITVAIVGILAGIAYPQYAQYVIRGKRGEGRSALLDAAARLERFYSDSSRYATAANTLATGTGICTGGGNCTAQGSESGFYNISITTSGTFQVYTLNATPVAPFVDNDCGVLTLTQASVKGEGGSSDVAGCWGR